MKIMEKLITKTIVMKAPSGSDDLHCADGEIEGGAFIFEAANTRPLPDEATSLNPTRMKRIGVWLSILAEGKLHFARWNGKAYDWFGEALIPPVAHFAAVARPLPPYSAMAGELPMISIQAPAGGDSSKDVLDWLASGADTCSATTRQNVINAVKVRLKEFLTAVRNAGLYFHPVRVAVARRLADGTLFQMSEPTVVMPPGYSSKLSLKIKAASCIDGTVYMNLELSRSPFAVEAGIEEEDGLAPIIMGTEVITAGEFADFSPDAISYPVWVDGASRGFAITVEGVGDNSFPSFPEADDYPAVSREELESAVDELVPITTRPLKLGDPFAIKKLREVEAVWADGSCLPVKVYGAARLGKWYFLGLAPSGRMLMLGSGWRFFRVETFAVFDGIRYLLPKINLRISA